MTETQQHPNRGPLTEVETWLEARLGQRLVVTLRDAQAGWFFLRMRGVLQQLIREDSEGADHTLEFRLDDGQEVVLYADLIDELAACFDPSTSGDGLAIIYRGGNLDIEEAA